MSVKNEWQRLLIRSKVQVPAEVSNQVVKDLVVRPTNSALILSCGYPTVRSKKTVAEKGIDL